MTEALMQRLRFSRAEIDATVEAVRQHMVFKDVPNMRIARLKRFMARPTFADELELHRVDCASSHGMLDNYEFLQAQAGGIRARADHSAAARKRRRPDRARNETWTAFRRNPRGGRDATIGGQLCDREEALAWVKKEYGPEERAE